MKKIFDVFTDWFLYHDVDIAIGAILCVWTGLSYIILTIVDVFSLWPVIYLYFHSGLEALFTSDSWAPYLYIIVFVRIAVYIVLFSLLHKKWDKSEFPTIAVAGLSSLVLTVFSWSTVMSIFPYDPVVVKIFTSPFEINFVALLLTLTVINKILPKATI